MRSVFPFRSAIFPPGPANGTRSNTASFPSSHRMGAMSESAGRVVMITGGGSGIGRATALLFGQEAARVAVIDCNEPSARETASLIKQQRGEALPLVADVSNKRDVENAVEAIVGRYGRLDLLFACAAT